MKLIFNALVGVTIIFLINQFWTKRKRFPIVEDQAMNFGNLPNSQAENSSTLYSKPKGVTAKEIGKFILLYFAVALFTSTLSGALAGLARAFTPQGYTIVKFSVPLLVYIGFLYFLSRKHSIAKSAKLLAYVYAILVLLRVTFLGNSETEGGETYFHSVLPFVVLCLLSGTVFLLKRSKQL